MSRIAGDFGLKPFLYTGGKMYDLIDLIMPDSQVTVLSAEGINDRGQITGFGTIRGKSCAFRLEPGR